MHGPSLVSQGLHLLRIKYAYSGVRRDIYKTLNIFLIWNILLEVSYYYHSD
ncbi:unnamed protein product [Brassica oleracea]|uniref:(rape) hypothetical protein n=1 Tax=Brassica napus TaxID=3708 RepID=A0A816IV88_BRANA|nr:unnamed protein product [Brassica napus]